MSVRHRRSGDWARLLSTACHVWHRRLGAVVALFVALLTVTGILLNHGEALALDRRHVRWEWLLDAYNIRAPTESVAFKVGDRWLTQIGERLFLDDRLLPERAEGLVGAARVGSSIVAAFDRDLILFEADGRLFERLGTADGVPAAGIQAVGVDGEGRLMLRAGGGQYTFDLEALDWREAGAGNEVTWAVAGEAPGQWREAMLVAYRGEGLTLERVLLDLHSGRIAGRYGVYVVDGVALVFLALAMSGFWMWLRGRLTTRRRRSGPGGGGRR
jgi:hypothetical protein